MTQMDTETVRLAWYWEMCLSCARAFSPGDEAYAQRSARLLFGTGLQESGFEDNRQVNRATGQPFPFSFPAMAWGLWQQESIAIEDCMRRLARRERLNRIATTWLFDNETAPLDWFTRLTRMELCRLTAGWDRLSCMWARVYYTRDRAPIPDSAEAQAEYWGRVYNTREEAAKNAQWLAGYEAGMRVLEDARVVVA